MATKTWPYPTNYHEWIAQTNALRDEVARLEAENKLLSETVIALEQLNRENAEYVERSQAAIRAFASGFQALLGSREASGG